jgi:outer membrane biosynthesis protein TonB
MNIRSKLLVITTLFILIFPYEAFMKGSSILDSQTRPPLTDTELDGLNGRVRKVHTQTKMVTHRGNELIEGEPVVLEISSYGPTGKKINTVYHANPNAIELTGREVYKHDEKGNIIELTLLGKDGTILNKEKYQYEFDGMGNWIKMSIFVAVVVEGKLEFELKEVTTRNIEYYDVSPSLPAKEVLAKATPTPEKTAAAKSGSLPTPIANSQSIKSNPTPLPVEIKSTVTANLNASPSKPEIKPTETKPKVDVATNDNGGVTSISASINKTPARPANYRLIRTEEELLNGKALTLPEPPYPPTARVARAKGLVVVEVIIDTNGRVVSAHAVSGNKLLYQVSEEAALKAVFTPTVLGGYPVKVRGKIKYFFNP